MAVITQVPWLGIGCVSSGVALATVAGYLLRYRTRPGANWFIASLSMQSLWCLSYGVALFVAEPSLRLWLEVLAWIGLSWVGYLFLGFALDYTGYTGLRRSWLFRGLGIPPLVATGLLVTTPAHDLIWSGARLVRIQHVVALEYTFEVGGLLILIVGMGYAGVGVLLLADTVLSYGRLFRREAVAVGVSTVPPTAGLLFWMLGDSALAAINWGVVLSLPHAVLDAYAFVGTDMFQSNPTTRRVADREAIDTVPDPILVLDPDGRIVDVNAAARDVFGGLSEEAKGRPMTDVLPVDASYTDDGSEGRLSVLRDGERLEFRVRSTALVDSRDATVGYSVLFQDVTNEHEREQRLEVLNRVLRHNLRNKLNVIDLSATELKRRLDSSGDADLADRILDTSTALAATSEKARAFDDLRRREPAVREAGIGSVVREAVGAATQGDGPAIRTEVTGEPTLRTDPDVLRLALDNVLENALEHTAGDSIRVRVGAADDPEYRLCIEVADAGAGIPAHEIDVVKGGVETGLDHGSGIGLWIMEWSLERLGGAVEYELEDGGTTVRLLLPADPTHPE